MALDLIHLSQLMSGSRDGELSEAGRRLERRLQRSLSPLQTALVSAICIAALTAAAPLGSTLVPPIAAGVIITCAAMLLTGLRRGAPMRLARPGLEQIQRESLDVLGRLPDDREREPAGLARVATLSVLVDDAALAMAADRRAALNACGLLERRGGPDHDGWLSSVLGYLRARSGLDACPAGRDPSWGALIACLEQIQADEAYRERLCAFDGEPWFEAANHALALLTKQRPPAPYLAPAMVEQDGENLRAACRILQTIARRTSLFPIGPDVITDSGKWHAVASHRIAEPAREIT
ncbi:hypothetical protein [Miltoncostaea oceani]|uniref:hypothetical protein n=1 Tax=Miltoncostaea oceani TaxID=2843216 RepID=UPI001C3E637A|nr:hypothetical protein [Miltoncostaea oceani]